MTALPGPLSLALSTSFTALSTNNPTAQQPGGALDAEFNNLYRALKLIVAFLGVSLGADGTLLTAAVEAAVALASGSSSSGTVNVADAPSAASALLAQAWAEYLPGELPAGTLASTGVTGDHFSSRWWANAAAQLGLTAEQVVASMIAAFNLELQGQIASGSLTLAVAPTVAPLTPFAFDGATRTFALSRSDTNASVVPQNAASIFLFVANVAQRPGTEFTVSGANVTFAVAPANAAANWGVWIAPDTALQGAPTTSVFDGGSY